MKFFTSNGKHKKVYRSLFGADKGDCCISVLLCQFVPPSSNNIKINIIMCQLWRNMNHNFYYSYFL